MPSDSFTYTAHTTGDRPDIWNALQLPETWEGIAGVDRVYNPVIDAEDRLRGFDFDTRVAGKAYAGRAVPHARDEGSLIAWNIENSEVRGMIEVVLSDVDNGTEVSVSLDVSSKGLLSTMFFGAVSKTIGGGLPRTVEEMARRFDSS